MKNIFTKGGFAHGPSSLCVTCESAHIVTGYRGSEMVVICTDVTPNLTVRFEVRECTQYSSRDRPAPPAKRFGFFPDQGVREEVEVGP